MNLSTYINSGELELYVLDRLSPDERRRVEQYAEQHPEVKAELTEIELALEKYALLRGQTATPSPAVLSGAVAAVNRSSDPIPPQSPAEKRTGGFNPLTWILGAALLAALAALFYLYGQANDRAAETSEIQQRFTTLEQDCERIRDNNQESIQQLALLSDVNTSGIVLSGSPNAPDSRAVIFYNQEAGEVLFSASNLPIPPAGKQYQLWAINDAGPQDLGVLSRNLSPDVLLDVRFIPQTRTFAITLEDEGGKPGPDLSQLQVIGDVGP